MLRMRRKNSGLRPTRRRTVGGAAPAFPHWRERSGLSAPASDPIPALTGTHDQVRQAERLRYRVISGRADLTLGL